MESNLLDLEPSALLGELLSDADGPLYVVNPSVAVVEAVVDAGTDLEGDHPEVRLLADAGVLKAVFEDFIFASEAADLLAADALTLRTAEELPENALVASDAAVFALVDVGRQLGALGSDDAGFVAAAADEFDERWTDAEPYTLRTPAISAVRSSMDEDLGADVRRDFDGVMASLETARGAEDDLDEVTVSLLVAAKNDVLLYDVSKWGEDVGIASKATFSRTKSTLEERGIIDTEKVPIEVGRPRLRLKLADERLQEADPADVASVAQSVLAS